MQVNSHSGYAMMKHHIINIVFAIITTLKK